MYMEITSLAHLKELIANGPYTFPGCYPIYFMTECGDVLSFNTVKKEFDSIRSAYEYNDKDWLPKYADINYEHTDMHCVHSGELIESAYGQC